MKRNFVAKNNKEYKSVGNGNFNCPGDKFIFMPSAGEDEYLFVGQDDKLNYFSKSGKPAKLSQSAIEAIEEGADMSDFIVRAFWTVWDITDVKHEKVSIKYWITPKSTKTKTENVKRLDNDILAQMLGITVEEIEKDIKSIDCPELSKSESKLFSQKDYTLRKEVLLAMFFNCLPVRAKAEAPLVAETTTELTRQQKAALTKAANKLKAGK